MSQKPAANFESRAERMRRGRASAQALRAVYPQVQHLRLKLSFEGASSHTPSAQSHVLYPSARAFFAFPCPNAGCDGEFDLAAVVQRTVDDRKHDSHGTIVCTGSRVVDLNARQTCGLQLNYAVTALL
jgi:hypothetical protein